MPFAGSSYTYVSAALGEFLAWITVSNVVFETILSNAAAARGFSPYFAALIGKEPTFFIMPVTMPNGAAVDLDWWAFGIGVAMMALLLLGTRESAAFNTASTVLHVALVLMIIIAGFCKASPANATPFAPFGVRGVFQGASIVFFSYIGAFFCVFFWCCLCSKRLDAPVLTPQT